MIRIDLRAVAKSAGAAAVAISGVVLIAGQAPSAPVFTADQASAGRATYQERCAGCHMPDLGGRNEAPPLAGANFMSTWGSRTTRELFDYMSAGMPPNGPSLSPSEYAAITRADSWIP